MNFRDKDLKVTTTAHEEAEEQEVAVTPPKSTVKPDGTIFSVVSTASVSVESSTASVISPHEAPSREKEYTISFTEPNVPVSNIPENTASTTGRTIPLLGRNTPEHSFITIPFPNTPECIGSTPERDDDMSNRNESECEELARESSLLASNRNTPELEVLSAGLSALNYCDLMSRLQLTAERNVDWCGSATPLPITCRSIASESNQCTSRYLLPTE